MRSSNKSLLRLVLCLLGILMLVASQVVPTTATSSSSSSSEHGGSGKPGHNTKQRQVATKLEQDMTDQKKSTSDKIKSVMSVVAGKLNAVDAAGAILDVLDRLHQHTTSTISGVIDRRGQFKQLDFDSLFRDALLQDTPDNRKFVQRKITGLARRFLRDQPHLSDQQRADTLEDIDGWAEHAASDAVSAVHGKVTASSNGTMSCFQYSVMPAQKDDDGNKQFRVKIQVASVQFQVAPDLLIMTTTKKSLLKSSTKQTLVEMPATVSTYDMLLLGLFLAQTRDLLQLDTVHVMPDAGSEADSRIDGRIRQLGL